MRSQHLAILVRGNVVLRLLVGIRLTLMPQHRAEAVRSELPHAADHAIKELAGRAPFSGADLGHEFPHGRRDVDAVSLWQPLPHARRSMADACDPDRHVVPGVHRIAERRDEAAVTCCCPERPAEDRWQSATRSPLKAATMPDSVCCLTSP